MVRTLAHVLYENADHIGKLVGEGSFFKTHRDTPCSQDMFGSFVVFLHISHKRGDSLLGHGGGPSTIRSHLLRTHRRLARASFQDCPSSMPRGRIYTTSSSYPLIRSRPHVHLRVCGPKTRYLKSQKVRRHPQPYSYCTQASNSPSILSVSQTNFTVTNVPSVL